MRAAGCAAGRNDAHRRDLPPTDGDGDGNGDGNGDGDSYGLSDLAGATHLGDSVC
jgi:hypothetical protein